VAAFTQARASGAFTGRRYGSFAGKGQVRGGFTQPRAFGAFTGMRYGAFSGKPLSVVQPTTPVAVQRFSGGIIFPEDVRIALRRRFIDEDDLLLLLSTSLLQH
jgi:hypothetical protein